MTIHFTQWRHVAARRGHRHPHLHLSNLRHPRRNQSYDTCLRDRHPHLICVRAQSVCLIPCDCCSLGCVTALCCSARALLTSPALRGKASRTSNSTPQPRAPPAELAGDVAGGESEVGSDASLGGRLSVGCLGRLFHVSEVPPGGPRRLCRLCRRFWRRRLAHRHVCSPGTRAGPGTASGRYARAEGRTAQLSCVYCVRLRACTCECYRVCML